jgi:hypothetical protein
MEKWILLPKIASDQTVGLEKQMTESGQDWPFCISLSRKYKNFQGTPLNRAQKVTLYG